MLETWQQDCILWIHSIHVSYNTLTKAFMNKILGGNEASINGMKWCELKKEAPALQKPT